MSATHPIQADIDAVGGTIRLPRYTMPRRDSRSVDRDEIVEVVDWFPPAVLLKDGEFVFVSREQLDEIKAFCSAQDVPFTMRYDVWSDVLEPFLDTEFSADMREGTRQRLRDRAGLSDAEIDALRARVETQMLGLTGLTWEWQHYGLYDVLHAMKPWPIINRAEWEAFYAEAMEIARRGMN